MQNAQESRSPAVVATGGGIGPARALPPRWGNVYHSAWVRRGQLRRRGQSRRGARLAEQDLRSAVCGQLRRLDGRRLPRRDGLLVGVPESGLVQPGRDGGLLRQPVGGVGLHQRGRLAAARGEPGALVAGGTAAETTTDRGAHSRNSLDFDSRGSDIEATGGEVGVGRPLPANHHSAGAKCCCRCLR